MVRTTVSCCATANIRDLYPGIADLIVPGIPFPAILRAVVDRKLIDLDGKTPEGWIAERMRQHTDPKGFSEYQYNATWVRISERRMPDGSTVSVYTDITELKQRQTELEQAMEQADQANQAKSSFLANMSHELRTPLNAIIGYSEILQEDAADKDDKAAIEDLQKIERAGRHLLGLINNILDLSKIEAGKMDIYIEPVDIQALVKEVLSIVKPLADKNENAVEVICPADIGSFRSDQTKVKQCLLNLMSNANKFTTKGVLTLTVARETGCAGLIPGIGHRRRHDGRTTRPAVPGVQPGGCLDHQTLRRHGPWARHHQAVLHHAGR